MRKRAETPGGPRIDVEPLRYHPGDVVADKYRLVELLGEGGMGTVWRAENTALGVDVAVKLVHGELLGAESTERLRREAHAAAKLEHPSAVRVFDLGETVLGDSFIVMELLRGQSLRELYEKRSTLRPEELVSLMLPIASALAAAHQKGIVHRDLKPENVMLVEAESGAVVPKVVDFGIAKVEGAHKSGRATQDGTILGSPDYMSPEQARGDVELIDARTDVWALGIVLYEGLVGRAPFTANHPLALLRAVIEDTPTSPEANGVADPKLSAIVMRALAKAPDDRFPDMRAMGRALAEWATDAGLDTDATGASIGAHWLRAPARSSLTSDLAFGGGSSPGLSGPASRSSLRGTGPDSAPRPFEDPPSDDASSARVVRTLHAQAKPPGDARPSRRAVWLVGGVAIAAGVVGTLVVSGKLSGKGAPRATSSAVAVEASAPTPSAALSAAEAAPTASASPAVEAAPLDVTACVASLFPEGSFAPNATLDAVCAERDPRKTGTLLRGEIARHGTLQKTTTDAMRTWANLSWYELATAAVVQGRCCASAKDPTELPPSVGSCPDVGAAIDALAAAVRASADPEPAVTAFRAAVLCLERGHRINPDLPSPYSYQGPPGGGAESAFRKILGRASKR